ncbi:hypothetical protein LCGC14_2568240, partial [marine sediment metagenome]
MCNGSLFHFQPSDDPGQAALRLDPTQRSDRPVSALLYGKFCEHLGSNIYQGMEAQVLYNPTFGDPKVREDAFTKIAARFGWPDAKPVAEAYADGGAFGWMRVGPDGAVQLSPDAGPYGARAQRVETPAATAEEMKC